MKRPFYEVLKALAVKAEMKEPIAAEDIQELISVEEDVLVMVATNTFTTGLIFQNGVFVGGMDQGDLLGFLEDAHKTVKTSEGENLNTIASC